MGRLLLTDGVIDLDRGEVVRGQTVTRLTAAERELLGYLAARAGRDVSRDELHERVWGHPPTVMSRAADFSVHRVRRKIEVSPSTPRHLLTIGGGYRWVPADSPGAPDGDQVVVLVAEPVRAGDAPWLAACVVAAREAGAAIADLAPDRVVLAAAAADAAVDAAHRLAALGPTRFGLAVGPAERLVDPLSGRTLYGGVTLERAARLARAAPVGAVPDVPGAADAASTPAAELPARIDRFVGREDLLAELRAAGPGPIVLVGPPGAGKSRLALELGLRTGLSGWVVTLDDRDRTVEEAVSAVARALGLGGGAVGREDVGRALASRTGLLVLDGVERTDPAFGVVIGGWTRPDLWIVVTTRDRREVPGATEIAVGGLDTDEGVALLRDRDRTLAASEALAALVHDLDGLPLALELVVPRLRILSVQELRARLSLDVLAGRDRTMRAALDASWDRLPPPERRTLVAATVFAGPFDLAGAEAVLALPEPGAPWFVDLLQALCDRHLVQVDPPILGRRRFRLLAVVRAYAREHGAADPSLLGDAVHRHATHFAALIRRMSPYGEVDAGPEILDDVLFAARAAIDGGWVPLAVDAARVYVNSVLRWGDHVHAAPLVRRVLALDIAVEDQLRLQNRWIEIELRTGNGEHAIALARDLVARVAGRPAVWRSRANQQLASALRFSSHHVEALAVLEEAEALADDPVARGLLRCERALTERHLGRLERSLTILRGPFPDEPSLTRNMRMGRGTVALIRGEVDEAIVDLEFAVSAFTASGDRYRGENSRQVLSTALLTRGETARGTALARQALGGLKELGAWIHVMYAHVDLAAFALQADDLEAAAFELAEAGRYSAGSVARARGTHRALLVELRARQGDRVGSQEAETEARELLGDGQAVALAQLDVHRGMARLAVGDRPDAERILERVEAAGEALGLLPAAFLAQEIRRLRRAVRRA